MTQTYDGTLQRSASTLDKPDHVRQLGEEVVGTTDWKQRLQDAKEKLIEDRKSNRGITPQSAEDHYDQLDERSAKLRHAELVWGFANEGIVPPDWVSDGDGWIAAIRYIDNLEPGRQIDTRLVYPLLTHPHWQVVNALASKVKLPKDAMPVIQRCPEIDAYHFRLICEFQGWPNLDPR